jgi:hypothetical protein
MICSRSGNEDIVMDSLKRTSYEKNYSMPNKVNNKDITGSGLHRVFHSTPLQKFLKLLYSSANLMDKTFFCKFRLCTAVHCEFPKASIYRFSPLLFSRSNCFDIESIMPLDIYTEH